MPAFGTSGLRGLAVELTDDLCARYTLAFVGLHPNDGTVLIGRDLRESSPRIASAVAQGARSAGLAVVDCGVLPTPALALAAEERGTVAIMVTGSHIPADRNGLKFYTGAGEITKSDEADLVAALVNVTGYLPSQPSDLNFDDDAQTLYKRRFTDFFAAKSLGGLKVGVWQQSSAARDILPDILTALGARVTLLERSKTFIPIDTEAVDPAVRTKLAAWTAEHGLDAIVSTDGDADRPMVADADGRIIPGDILGPLSARHLGATHVVTPVSSNTLVEKMDLFASIDRCRIGSPYVIAGMEERMRDPGAKVIGYEANGGVLLGFKAMRGDNSLAALMTRDSTLPIVAVLAEATARASTLAGLVADLPSRRTATDRLTDVPTEVSRKLAANLVNGDLAILPEGLGDLESVDTTDGARLTFDTGVIVTVRPSGNAPELRCYVEADTETEAQRLLAATLAGLRKVVDA